MPAKVIVQSGISAGTSHWIERPVVRIGSDPRSDVFLPTADVPGHALTLEFRDGRYRVYNRCETNLFVGTQIVAPGQALEWPDTDILKLNHEIELILDVEDDPTPGPPRVAAEFDNDDNSDLEPIGFQDAPAVSTSTSGKPADGSKMWLQVVVIALCILGSVGLLVREQFKQTTRRDPPSFAAVVRAAIASPSTSPALVQRLQYAESAVIRGDIDSAADRFRRLRDDLISQANGFVADNRQAELAILDFVEYRLGQLE